MQEESTHGIDIHPWQFELDQGHHFQANIWDFGGQEIYHATHQFFLTQRSLYILVVDERKEDNDFDYWLNIIELLGKDSPVIIFQNEKSDRLRKIDERGLRGRFPNLKEIISFNLKTGRSSNPDNPKNFYDFLELLKFQLQQLPHVGEALPKTWKTSAPTLKPITVTILRYSNI